MRRETDTYRSCNKGFEIFNADRSLSLSLPFALSGIVAGFPSPASDYIEQSLDLNSLVIRNPSSTFYGRVKGNSMIDAGIAEGDIVVIDKSLQPQSNMIAVCYIDGEFTVKRIEIKKDIIYLMPANQSFKPIKVTEENNFLIWGIVTYIIKKV